MLTDPWIALVNSQILVNASQGDLLTKVYRTLLKERPELGTSGSFKAQNKIYRPNEGREFSKRNIRYKGKNIAILIASQFAIRALDSCEIKSKIVWQSL